jgi:two-component system chemotaxis sensor kinase CheA
MIEDPELRGLFQSESEERLNHLENGLKELEKNPFDQELIEGIFRDAHTIKGAARMFEILSIEKIAHHMEEVLDGVRRKRYILTSVAISQFYKAIDAIRALVTEAVRGTPSGVNVEVVSEGLNVRNLEKQREPAVESRSAVAQPSTSKEGSFPSKEPQDQAQQREVERSSNLEKGEIETAKILHRVASQSLQSPTIRIQTEQLNELMVQAGNLTVSKNRIYGLLEQLDQLIAYLEKISRHESWQCFIGPQKQIEGEKQGMHLQKEGFENLLGLIDKLNQLRSTFADDFYALGGIMTAMSDRIRTLGLVPLSNLFDLFPRMVSELASACGKKVDFFIEGGEITVEKRIIEEMKDPIMHILRNAISHGIEFPEEREVLGKPSKGKIELKASQTANRIILEISDDGRGLDLRQIKQAAIDRKIASSEEVEAMSPAEIQALIFTPGFSTTSKVTEISGRGIGMNVVRTRIEKLNGIIQVESKPGLGFKIFIQLPITLVTTHVLLVEVKKNIYAIPIDMIEACALISNNQLFTMEGRDVICINDQPISVALLADLLNIPHEAPVRQQDKLSCVILKVNGKRVAALVDAILEEQQVVVSPANFLFGSIRTLAGATILKTGRVCVVLNVYDLIKDLDKGMLTTLSMAHKSKLEERKKKILFVDDSYVARIMIKKILEEEDFDVILAEDGVDALAKLSRDPSIDAIVTDLEMPKMNGINLIKKVRLIQNYYSLPIILFTAVTSEELRKEGLEAGATAYLVKSDYNQNQLIKTLREILVR